MHLQIKIKINKNIDTFYNNRFQIKHIPFQKQKYKIQIIMASNFPKLPGFFPTQDLDVIFK